ncbi:hypothetical protein FQN55_009373 [Onygenales sp. PD_40]|nr:hypothetical protein FQN55_009373 [Onygenales sp. PD_40]KAK2781517.1 hypothetical protein FQN53_000533 [Emmonsiellopsis sp. PD_33]KAK2782325.1 hypothetical protein FQN52_000970 [Onygenales sp. PD_12]
MVFSIRLAAVVGSLLAATTPVLGDICEDFENQGRNVERPLSLSFEEEQTNYWSTACAALRSRCMLAPNSTEEMAEIVAALQDTTDQFAVKSGGHMPNPGFASISEGILISTKNLDQVTYDSETETVVVGPGLMWEEILEAIEPTGRVVVGGRMGAVGVGGYLLGGGLSFLSAEYGWGVNNIINFEVVLANATIVNANAEENPELFAVMKGGGSNFGIVTAFTLKTHPIEHDVWGGNYVFGPEKSEQLLEAVRDFTEYNTDDKAAIILTLERGAILNTWIMFLFYDGIEPPAGVFDNFTHIGPTIDITKRRSYLDLCKFNDIYILVGQRYVIGTETIPLPNKDNGAKVLGSIFDHWNDIVDSVITVPNVIASIAFQPMPRAITGKANKLGGDVMDFEPDHDYIVLELDFSYAFPASDNLIDQGLQNLYNGIHNLINDHAENGLVPDIYRPLFMNDAYHRQDYWARNRNADKARAVQKAVDPEGFFQVRTSGGFRL